MPRRKSNPLEHVLGRLDNLDPTNLTNLVQRLARERKLLETVFNTIHEGIIVIDNMGVINYANDAAGSLLGFSIKEVGKTVFWKLVPDLARTLDIRANGEFDEVSIITRELELSYPENRLIRLYIMPLEDSPDEEILRNSRYTVIISDITEDKMTTQEKIENEKISSILMLAAGVAHELGNPLNSLTIHLQLMRRNLDKLEEGSEVSRLKKSLFICNDEVMRLDSIITHFLEAVRPSPPDFQDIVIIDVLEQLLELYGSELDDAGITINVELASSLPIISADPNQLKQVFFNILKNAREAMPDGGTIKVRARSDDEFVHLQFGDSGIGIDKDSLSRVFQPYYTTKKGGHGLGMMIVQRILRDHGAQIGIDSRPGIGTVIMIQFPQKHRRIRLLTS